MPRSGRRRSTARSMPKRPGRCQSQWRRSGAWRCSPLRSRGEANTRASKRRTRPIASTRANNKGGPQPAVRARNLRAGAPDINAGEQKQPDDVDEVPIPGGELEAEMLGRRELPGQRAPEANDQEDRPDDDMCAVEAGRHEESRPIDIAAVAERCVVVFERLHRGEREAQKD